MFWFNGPVLCLLITVYGLVSPDVLPVGQLCISVPILEWDNPAGKTYEARSQYALHPSKQEVPKGLAHQRQEAKSANQHP